MEELLGAIAIALAFIAIIAVANGLDWYIRRRKQKRSPWAAHNVSIFAMQI